jgi:hypothetical protein
MTVTLGKGHQGNYITIKYKVTTVKIGERSTLPLIILGQFFTNTLLPTLEVIIEGEIGIIHLHFGWISIQ